MNQTLYGRLFPLNEPAQLWVLLDPDSSPVQQLLEVAVSAEQQGASAILVGGSFITIDGFDIVIKKLKEKLTIPVVLFPGGHQQLSKHADGLLYISLLSGRNPQYLIGEQVMAAPLIKRMKLETIPTAYLLIESGHTTSTEFVSNTKPIPRDKPQLVAAHAQAAELFGMKAVYLEAGSGAYQPVPTKVIATVSRSVDIPVIVGGGITTPEVAAAAVRAGARSIVIGTVIEENGDSVIQDIVKAIQSAHT